MHQNINSYLAILLVGSVAFFASLMIIEAAQIDTYESFRVPTVEFGEEDYESGVGT